MTTDEAEDRRAHAVVAARLRRAAILADASRVAAIRRRVLAAKK